MKADTTKLKYLGNDGVFEKYIRLGATLVQAGNRGVCYRISDDGETINRYYLKTPTEANYSEIVSNSNANEIIRSVSNSSVWLLAN